MLLPHIVVCIIACRGFLGFLLCAGKEKHADKNADKKAGEHQCSMATAPTVVGSDDQ